MKSKWIPVTERLPEVPCDCIVTGKKKYDFEKEWEYFTDAAFYTGEYIDGFETFNDWDEGQEIHIIAWMPLPEPYKEEL